MATSFPMTRIAPGERGTILPSGAYGADTFSSGDFHLTCGGGAIIWLEVTDINGATITTLNLQAKVGDSYVTIWQAGSLSITANGIYGFRIAPGCARAAGANAYKAVAEDVPCSQGRVQIVNTVAAATFNVRIESVG